MSTITKEQLEKEIGVILNDADLAAMSTKKVREELEKTFKCDLSNRRQEIKEIVMEIVNSKESEDEAEESEKSSSESEPEPAPKATKRAAAAKKAPAKKKKKATSDDENSAGSDADGNSEEAASDPDSEEERPKKATPAKGKKRVGRRKKGSDSDSDDDWKKPKKAKKTTKGTGKGKGTGFTRPYTLSADLASLMGAESLPRHEVVKKMWAMIKERNLYDPKNKQYAICDSDLLKVIGVKRFRTFAMLKYLKPHFIN